MPSFVDEILEKFSGLKPFKADVLVAPGIPEKAAALAARFHARARGRKARPLLVVVPDRVEAQELADALAAFFPDEVRTLEAWDALPFEPTSLAPAAAAGRVEILAALAGDESRRDLLVVASARAVARRTLSPAAWKSRCRRLAFADEIPPAVLRAELIRDGFRSVPEVSDPGEMAVRGGILDLFPPGLAEPARIEWDGDLISSIRLFDIETQRSRAPVDAIRILPPRELSLPESDEERAAAKERIAAAIKPSLRRDRFLDAIDEGVALEGVEIFLPFIEEPSSLFDLGGCDTVLVDEPMIRTRLEEIFASAQQEAAESDLGHDPALMWLATLPEIADAARIASFPSEGILSIATEPLPPAPLDSSILRTDLARLVENGDHVLIVSSLASRVKEILHDLKIEDERMAVVAGNLGRGARFPSAGVALVGDGDLFGHGKRSRSRGAKRRLLSWGALQPNEYVVHIHHGVGVFRGIERIKTLGEVRDVILIEYAGGDKLYLPPHETDLFERYTVAEGVTPKLDKLGAAGWAKVRDRVERETAEIARELIDLYALRSMAEGAVFKEAVEEERFSDAFGYEETPDQQRAIEEIGAELEKSENRSPMDRLLCGDVGFGKTEVALRAAFRVVQGGRQVAVLCPTTILALQHTRTFRERLEPFGVSVGTMSRFQSPKEHATTAGALADGSLRVVVGTHKLLSVSVRFKELGLVVIDEEQRFGVRHKEHLKNLRKQVDVLTMTATPIPRTLHLALSGVRSISLIETPPPGRAAVQTVVEPFNEEHIRKAIRRELEREGQVFYVHNRIETIDRVHDFLRRLFPKVRIDVGHGQMSADELSDVMNRFLSGRTEILLSTSIVENGLDIPRANTMIVDMAERFGLSDLYQLRGRVGRSNRRAYAYFFYSAQGSLTREARARLAAIAEHTALGSGYAIARRDMEIRGAGEILGASQSGEMESVGYDMYCRLLREALAELRGEKKRSKKRAIVDLAVTAFLPPDWLGGDALISEVHREITSAQTVSDVEKLRESLVDRFGVPPEPVENLLELARLRAYADLDGVASIIENERGVSITWEKIPKGIEQQLTTLPPPVYVTMTGPTALLENLPAGKAKLARLRKLLRR